MGEGTKGVTGGGAKGLVESARQQILGGTGGSRQALMGRTATARATARPGGYGAATALPAADRKTQTAAERTNLQKVATLERAAKQFYATEKLEGYENIVEPPKTAEQKQIENVAFNATGKAQESAVRAPKNYGTM